MAAVKKRSRGRQASKINAPAPGATVIDKDTGWKALYKLTRIWGYTFTDAGVLESAGRSVVYKAAINEFGGEQEGVRIPARPFMSWAFDQHKRLYEVGIELALDSLFRTLKQSDAPQAIEALENDMEELGAEAMDHIKWSIKHGPWVPNAPLTIQKKGSDIPLIDTGELYGSIEFRVLSPKVMRAEAKARSSASIGRPPSMKKKLGALGRLGRGTQLYEGQGTRNRAERRPNAATGTASKGVRRKSSMYPSEHKSAFSNENRSGIRRK